MEKTLNNEHPNYRINVWKARAYKPTYLSDSALYKFRVYTEMYMAKQLNYASVRSMPFRTNLGVQ